MKEIFKKEIIVAILVSVLITFFIQPILNFFWSILAQLGSTILSRWLDDVYALAALGENNRIQVMSLSFVVVSLWVVAFILAGKYHPKKFHRIFSEKLEEEKDSMKLTLKQAEERRNELKKRLADTEKKLKKTIKDYTFVYYIYIASLVIFGSTIGLWVIQEYAVLQLNTSFNQQLTVLAVQITDHEYKELKGLWASMKTRQDYENIESKMNTMASQYQIELPKPLLP